ncbi:MAG: hypothetical protein ACM33T_11110 [Solirubrobacterales bacterium]
MRFLWTFFAGLVFAGFTLVVSAPLWLGTVGVAWLARGELWTTLSGESFFAVRADRGRTAGYLANVSFRTVMVPVVGEPRPRRLLLRVDVRNPDVFAGQGGGQGGGRVRVDAWHLDDASDLHKPALYTVIAPGNGLTVEDDMLMIERGGGRRSIYSSGEGRWLFDADTATAAFAQENERRRFVAVAAADEELPAGSIAVITYATSDAVLRRLLLRADDPTRARILRTAVTLSRPVARHDDSGRGRSVELPLPAGTLRIPMTGDAFDLAHASIPAGLALAEFRPWKN